MRRLRLFRRASVDEEVASELAFHLEMKTRDLIAQGMTPQLARAEAERRFGDRATVDAECRRYGTERDRSARRAEYLDELRQDVGFAIRQLVKARGFSIVAVLTLALGIGATAAVFSVLDAVVLQPLPYPDVGAIVNVFSSLKAEPMSPSGPEYLTFKSVHEFQYVAAAISGAGATIDLGGRPEMLSAGRVSADYFNVFGIPAMLGRTFNADEDAPGRSNVVVLGHRLWLSHFNGDRSVIGRVISIDGTPHTVLGVMPASFDVTKNSDDLWLPIALSVAQSTNFGEHFLNVVARLRPGVSAVQAAAAASAAEQVAVTRMTERRSPPTAYGAMLHSYRDDFTGDYRQRLFVLLGAVAFVLLIACSNVANLLLARSTARAKELAIRAALGAGRGRLVRQLLTESLVLSVAGAVIGLGVAFGLVRMILAVSPDDIPRLDRAGVDWRVLAFTLAISVGSSLIFGLVPALRSAGPRLQSALREGGRGSTSARDRLRSVFVATEVALAIALLVGAGLLIRSALLTQRVAPGFDARGILTSRIVLPATRYESTESILRVYRTIRDEAQRIPGVQSAALSSVVPLSGSAMGSSVQAEDAPKEERPPQANIRLVSHAYLQTMRIPFIAGHDIAESDNASAPGVIVINEALARKLWPSLDPRATLGKRIHAISDNSREVVGVVANIHDASLTKAPEPEIYVPFEQTPEVLWSVIQRSLVVVLRAQNERGSADALTEPLRRAVASVDPSLPLADHRTMESYLHASLQLERMNTILLSTLGAIALVLAMVGIYGVVSYFVSQRTNEIGLRVALGATPGAVWQFVMHRGLRPIVAGLVIGIVLSLMTTNLIREQLYGVTPRDPLTLCGVAGLLLAVAMVAMYIPARRAMRVPPIVALNER